MTLPELCIRRPVMTTLLMVAFVVFGVMAYRALPVSELPNVDFPVIQVQARMPGADPETMASSVATVLEAQFSTIAGVDAMTSSSSNGNTRITLMFNLDRNIDAAAQDVAAGIIAAQRRLPSAMPSPPFLRKVNPADQPILYLAMSSPMLPLQVVNEWAETQLAQMISTVPGVAQVLVFGSQKRAVRVRVNPDAMATRGIGIDEVERAIRQANSNLPTGELSGRDKALAIRTTGQLSEVDAYLRQIILMRNGAPVRLSDIGTAIEGVENDKNAGWFNNNRAIILAIQRQPGTNTIEVVDSIRKILPSFRAQLPGSIDLNVLYDRSQSIRASVHEVQFTLVLASILVVLVIFLFLRNLSATVIPSLALPISIAGTFAVMHVFGFSLDNLSLLALTLAVGFVVDDAIVMLENIVRHIEQGETPMQAALKGSREIGFTIISMTVSLFAVFIPVMFMGGVVGRLLHEFAVTITAAIIVSGIVSLTLTPMMCSRFIRVRHDRKPGALFRASERVFAGMLKGYDHSLRWCLGHKRTILVVFLATVVGSVFLFRAVPKDFLPSEDTGQIIVFTEGAQDASFASMVRLQRQIADMVLREPEVAALMSSVGAGGPRATPNSGLLFVRLKPRDTRMASATQIAARLRRKLAGVAGVRAFASVPPPLRLTGMPTKSEYQFTMKSLNLDGLYSNAQRFENALRRQPGFTDVTTDLDISSPTAVIRIDRAKAASLGLTMEQIEGALNSAFGAQQISTIFTASNQYAVILELEPRFRRGPDAISLLHIRSSTGKLVPLTAIAEVRPGVGPLTVNHQGQLPSVTISFNLAPGVPLGVAIERLRTLERELKIPADISTGMHGTAQAFQEASRGLGLLLLLAIVVVYIVLGILYESFIHPLTILSGLPSAAVGALLVLMWFDVSLSLYAFVGIIMLVGIVKKNAIMMIDFALQRQRKHGIGPEAAIYEACLVRFRPIMMTTMAALLGTLPIALAIGAGSESRVPLGLTVVGGLALSQILTLYLTPVIYIYMEQIQAALRFRRKAEPAMVAPPAPAE